MSHSASSISSHVDPFSASIAEAVVEATPLGVLSAAIQREYPALSLEEVQALASRYEETLIDSVSLHYATLYVEPNVAIQLGLDKVMNDVKIKTALVDAAHLAAFRSAQDPEYMALCVSSGGFSSPRGFWPSALDKYGEPQPLEVRPAAEPSSLTLVASSLSQQRDESGSDSDEGSVLSLSASARGLAPLDVDSQNEEAFAIRPVACQVAAAPRNVSSLFEPRPAMPKHPRMAGFSRAPVAVAAPQGAVQAASLFEPRPTMPKHSRMAGSAPAVAHFLFKDFVRDVPAAPVQPNVALLAVRAVFSAVGSVFSGLLHREQPAVLACDDADFEIARAIPLPGRQVKASKAPVSPSDVSAVYVCPFRFYDVSIVPSPKVAPQPSRFGDVL